MDAASTSPRCLGRPFVEVRTRLQPSAEGVDLLQLSGKVLGRYLDSESPTFYALEGDVWYDTGDVVQVEEGKLIYKGRIDNQASESFFLQARLTC